MYLSNAVERSLVSKGALFKVNKNSILLDLTTENELAGQ